MRKQVLSASAILCLIGGTCAAYAAEKNQMPWSSAPRIAEQTLRGPNFGPPRGKLGLTTPEALQRELSDDRFISDLFTPIRLIFPDGRQDSAPARPHEVARVLKVQPLTGEHLLKAFAKDVPFNPDAAKSASAVDDTPLVAPRLLFDRRRVKEWSK